MQDVGRWAFENSLPVSLQVREARDVDRLARKLEDAIGPITLKWTTSRSSPDKSTMDRLVSLGLCEPQH